MNQLPRESGTAMSDVPHQYLAPVDENDMYVSRAAGVCCKRCGRGSTDGVHTRWSAMNTASRESASSLLPRVHG